MNLAFWSRWLTACGILTALSGAGFVFFYDTAVFAPLREGVNAAFAEPVPVAYARFVHAVLGATMAGWGVSLALIAAVPFRRGERWAWWAIAGPFALWFVLDTGASLLLGVRFNAALNAALFAPVAAALAASYRAFAAAPGK